MLMVVSPHMLLVNLSLSLSQPTEVAGEASPHSSPSIAHCSTKQDSRPRFALWSLVPLFLNEWEGNSKSRRSWQKSFAGMVEGLVTTFYTWCYLLWEDQLIKGDIVYQLQGGTWCWRDLYLSSIYAVSLEFCLGLWWAMPWEMKRGCLSDPVFLKAKETCISLLSGPSAAHAQTLGSLSDTHRILSLPQEQISVN